jgi:hypothetical protein
MSVSTSPASRRATTSAADYAFGSNPPYSAVTAIPGSSLSKFAFEVRSEIDLPQR